eukprot:symbB.v1.2.019337.t1/scaffold1523.1/size113860/4
MVVGDPKKLGSLCLLWSCFLAGPLFISRWNARMNRRGLQLRSLSEDGALELLGLEHEISVEQRQLQQAFRAQARRLHPDSGGNAEDFQELVEAYTMLRRSLRHGGISAGKLKVAQEKWQKWEEEVEAGLELAQEGDVVYWRSAKGEPWQVAVVLAVQVVYEPSSGPHGWIYLQSLVKTPETGVFDADEEAEMDQVEPVSLDGVNWAFASQAEVVGPQAFCVFSVAAVVCCWSAPERRARMPSPFSANLPVPNSLAVGVRSYVLQQYYTFEYDLGLWPFGAVQVIKDRRSGTLKTCKAVEKSRLFNLQQTGDRLRALKEIQHPMLSSVHDILEDSQHFFIISSHAAGGDMGDWLDRRQLPLA